MSQKIRAIFQNGSFIPLEPFDFREDTEVELTVNESQTMPPSIADLSQRKKILAEIVRNMRSNPLPANAPHFTREVLHERR